jgi:hypothetical protein
MSLPPGQYDAYAKDSAVRVLVKSYGMRKDHAERAVDIAIEMGLNNTPYGDGNIVTITLVSRPTALMRGRGEADLVTITKFSDDTEAMKVAGLLDTDYSQTRRSNRPEIKESKMARRGTKQAEPEEPTVEDEAQDAEELDYRVYAEKDITATMTDFRDWIIQEVYEGDEAAFEEAGSDRHVALAGTLRMEFQRSDMNKERREERRQARQAEAEARRQERAAAKQNKAAATENDEEDAEDETPAPSKARRGRPAQASPATSKAKPGAAKASTKSGPARAGRRGRTQTESAPY